MHVQSPALVVPYTLQRETMQVETKGEVQSIPHMVVSHGVVIKRS